MSAHHETRADLPRRAAAAGAVNVGPDQGPYWSEPTPAAALLHEMPGRGALATAAEAERATTRSAAVEIGSADRLAHDTGCFDVSSRRAPAGCGSARGQARSHSAPGASASGATFLEINEIGPSADARVQPAITQQEGAPTRRSGQDTQSGTAGAVGMSSPAAPFRALALPVLACEGCGDAVVMGATCPRCRRAGELRRRLRARADSRRVVDRLCAGAAP